MDWAILGRLDAFKKQQMSKEVKELKGVSPDFMGVIHRENEEALKEILKVPLIKMKEVLYTYVHKETQEPAKKKLSEKELKNYVKVPDYQRTMEEGKEKLYLTDYGEYLIKKQAAINEVAQLNLPKEQSNEKAPLKVVADEEE